MQNTTRLALTTHFKSMSDPRMNRTKRHDLNDILVIAICAIICSCDDWISVEKFARAKRQWFETFLNLPNGIPSHDTFLRVFSLIDHKEFSRRFSDWVQSIAEADGDIIALDGKTVRRSLDRASRKAAIHMISAWSSQNQVVLGQIKTEEKSNEIAAIPKLLQGLVVRGSIITIDAMGCQKSVVDQVRSQDADYVLALKGNQGLLHAAVCSHLDPIVDADTNKNSPAFHEELSEGHGRKEVRRTWVTSNLDALRSKEGWRDLNSIAVVAAQRTLTNGKTTFEVRYYISSLKEVTAEQFAKTVRLHWEIENRLHWTLDMAFREDECRIRNGNGAQNFAILRHIALNLLTAERSQKIGIKNRRLLAGWDTGYLLKVLGF